MNHYTTIEQSKHLLELGLKAESADCMWEQHNGLEPYITIKPHTTLGRSASCHAIPCWSVGQLLELMPIITRDVDEYLPYLIKGSEIWKDKRRAFWYCTYALLDDSNVELQTFSEGTPIEACYNMIVWLLQNNYIKTE